MALNDYAYYRTADGYIENVIWVEDDVAPTLTWPDGYAIADIPTGGIAGKWSMCSIGWSYVGGQFVEPPNPNAQSALSAGINATDTTISLDSTDTFYTSGYLLVGDEWMSYSGVSGNSLTGVVRALYNTTAESHIAGEVARSSQVLGEALPISSAA